MTSRVSGQDEPYMYLLSCPRLSRIPWTLRRKLRISEAVNPSVSTTCTIFNLQVSHNVQLEVAKKVAKTIKKITIFAWHL